MNTTDFKSFNYLENGEITVSVFDTIKSTKKLNSGFYELLAITYPQVEVKLKVSGDIESVKINNFSDKIKLDSLFESFFNKNVYSKIKDLGFIHKFGILFYGKEGTGKSTIAKYYCNKAITEHDSIVFYIENTGKEKISLCIDFVKNIRRVQDNPIVIVFEEFDAQVEYATDAAILKSFLDGSTSIDNCIIFATTNHIDKIPEAMKNRPSRFKYVLNVENISNHDEILLIVKRMVGGLFNDEELDVFSKELENNTLDFIKQFCIDKIMNLETYKHKKNSNLGFANRN